MKHRYEAQNQFGISVVTAETEEEFREKLSKIRHYDTLRIFTYVGDVTITAQPSKVKFKRRK